ncbi:hypothetical protein J2Z48_002802 [Croceifilum oryzae]|uniref:Uncharacterized protein n=1 Tax=Croceifilum oryzae TaxID=1553429 RepID=A0AAJ1THJ5_9BACL|nr:hypothetical protein [Croceifilum oryzae]MDQ0418599.1 hypothetical protein [Croceifilum oryzae]
MNHKRSVMILFFIMSTLCFSNVHEAHALTPSFRTIPPIEIFDTTQEKVIATVQNSPEIQLEVKDMLHRITQRSPRANLEAKNQLMIRVPLEPSIYVQKDSVITGYISEVIVIISKTGSHSNSNLLLFNEENQPVLIECNFHPDSFLKKIGYQN